MPFLKFKYFILIIFFSAVAADFSCKSVLDKMCTNLIAHKQNLKIVDGDLYFGQSPKSNRSYISKIDDENLVMNIDLLPQELKTAVNHLKVVLINETDQNDWYSQLSSAKEEFQNSLNDLVKKRFENKFLKTNGNIIVDEFYLKEVEADVYDELFKIKYAKNPNWLRVERLFHVAKNDILELVKELPIESELKKLMAKQVLTVELTMPLQNRKFYKASLDCQTISQNAYYTSEYHKITICAGLFNAIQSDSEMYMTLAHEISHTIDLYMLPFNYYHQHNSLGQAINQIIGKHLSCLEWRVLHNKNEILSFPYFEKLKSCFLNSTKLEESSPLLIKKTISSYVEDVISSLTKNPIFDDFFNSPSLYYLQREYLLKNASYYPRDLNFLDILSEENFCSYDKQSPAEILQKSKEIYEKYLLSLHTFLNNQSDVLILAHLSHPFREEFADWMAYEVLYKYLKRIPVEKRLETFAVATTSYCPSSSVEDQDFADAERSLEYHSHPPDAVRRKNSITKSISDLLHCAPEKISPCTAF